MYKKCSKKIRSFTTLVLVMILSLCQMSIVFADDAWEGLTETAYFEGSVSSPSITDSEGYYTSIEDTDCLNSSYLKLTYTLSGDFTDETEVFIIKTYNTEWGGWEPTYITVGDSTLSDGVYSAYLSMEDILSTLTSGTLRGINIYFGLDSAYETTLTGIYFLAEESAEMTLRDWLGYTIDYCDNLDSLKYQSSSWAAFLTALETAKTVYSVTTYDDDTYQDAREELETAKAALLFVNSTDSGNPMDFRTLSGEETVWEMGVGWNLGNTMDGHTGFHPSETAWQSTITSKEMIKAIHDAGFNTIRVPVTWGDMIDDDNGYAINETWMSRVQDIVDYCTEMDMYTIINIHHDGADGWLAVGADDIDYVYEKFEGVWRNIAEKFKDYDEHLIFECANELTCTSHSSDDKNSAEAMAYDTPIIMNLNQIFVNTVRSTGSNNTKRWLAAISHFANRGTSNGFAMPTDSYNSENRLMFAHHSYKSTNLDTYSWSNAKELTDVIYNTRRVSTFTDIPIILGEYGTRNRTYSGNPSGYNDIGRAYYYECAARGAQVGMTVPVVWDQGCNTANVYETGVYTVWNRTANEPLFKTITDAMMRGMFIEPSSQNNSYDMSDIVSDPTITEITSITPDSDSVTIAYGESVQINTAVEPEDTNDVVIWKSADDSIATVYRGFIQGNKIGTTYVTAYSQSGSTEAVIEVTVTAADSDSPAEYITTDKESYTVAKGSNITIEAKADNGESLVFSSSNEDIASVNRLGKAVGKAVGTAYITIMAESGITKTVTAKVTEAANSHSLELAANVYYNDTAYASNEVGEPITVTEDGQYTLVFDTTTDLSSAASSAGISYLNNLTSIYIKDNDVTNGNSVVSPLDSCYIRYDKITLDGEELTITNTDFKSAIKDSGVLDTNDPVNSWDGSAVAEVTVSNHVLNFTTVTNPTRIEIVFTLKDLVFTEETSEDENPVSELTSDSTGTVFVRLGGKTELTVNTDPTDTTSLISFISSDESVVIVNDDAASVDGGSVCALLTGTKAGKATVTAIADNGVSLTFEVTVASNYFENVTAVTADGVITALTADVNAVPDLESITAIIALYDSSGEFKSAAAEEVLTSEITSDSLNVEGFGLSVSEGDTVKAFIWSGLEDMVPLG